MRLKIINNQVPYSGILKIKFDDCFRTQQEKYILKTIVTLLYILVHKSSSVYVREALLEFPIRTF